MNTYLFYDIETTGLNKSFDQVLQFAAIRTDMKLNEIDRHNIKIRLRPDVICSPRAMIINRISIAELMSGICEFEATIQIHKLLNEFGTISLGYNTLGFDDEFLRFSFYRNLLPPYTHQYHNGCYRMDLYPMTIMFWLYKNDVLTWPEVDGRASLKLENINAANSFEEGQAHDAMVDVLISLGLARKLYTEKDMWHYLSDCFIKKIDADRIEKLPDEFQSGSGIHRKGLMISGDFGNEQLYQAPVLSIGYSVPYSNQTLWLRLDLPELADTTPETIEETTWVTRKRLGEPPVILPPLERYWKRISKERSEIVKNNIQWLQGNPELFQKIINFHRNFTYPEIPDLDADAALYQAGFLSPKEMDICRKFHMAPLSEKIKYIDLFQNSETRALACRVLGRNYPDQLPTSLQNQFSNYLLRVNPASDNDALLDFKGNKRTTPLSALADIQKLRIENELDSRQITLLNELENYIRAQF